MKTAKSNDKAFIDQMKTVPVESPEYDEIMRQRDKAFCDRVAKHEGLTLGELTRKLCECSEIRGCDLEVSLRYTSHGGPQGDTGDVCGAIKSGGEIIASLSEYGGDFLAALEGDGAR